MKRTFLILIAFIILIGSLAFGFFYLNNIDLFNSDESNKSMNKSNIKMINAQYKVIEGTIEYNYEVSGIVTASSDKGYIDTVRLEWVNITQFEMLKERGEIFSVDEPIYKYKDEEYNATCNGRILNINYSMEEYNQVAIIEILNYDKLIIKTDIEEKRINDINYQTPVKYTYMDKEYETDYVEIGHEIIDGKLPVFLSMNQAIYPGQTLKVIFTTDIRDNGMYISKEAVQKVDDKYYVNILENDVIIQKDISVGMEFSIKENDKEFFYYEIIAGVNTEDKIVVPKVVYSADDLAGSLSYE